MREPLINDEEPRGAGDAFIESMTPRSHSGGGGCFYRVETRHAIYYIDGGASIYLGASRLYIWARHEINAPKYIDVPRQNIDAINL